MTAREWWLIATGFVTGTPTFAVVVWIYGMIIKAVAYLTGSESLTIFLAIALSGGFFVALVLVTAFSSQFIVNKWGPK